MQVIKYNVSKPKKYLSNGVEKTQWNTVGTMTEFHKDDGTIGRIIEIPAVGLEANIFPIEPKTETASAGVAPHKFDQTIGEVDPNDIPF